MQKTVRPNDSAYIHCKTFPVKVMVKILAAVLPTKNRNIYGNDNANRYFFTAKKPRQDGYNCKQITGKARKIYAQYMMTTVNG